MKLIKKFVLAAGLVALGATAVMAEGLDTISPDIVKRLYSKDMLDPARLAEFCRQKSPAVENRLCQLLCRQYMARRCHE